MSFLKAPPKPKEEVQEEGNPDPFGFLSAFGFGGRKRKNSDVEEEDDEAAQAAIAATSLTQKSPGLAVPEPAADEGIGMKVPIPSGDTTILDILPQAQMTNGLTEAQQQQIQEQTMMMQQMMQQKLDQLPPHQQELYKQRMQELQARVNNRNAQFQNEQGGGPQNGELAVMPQQGGEIVPQIAPSDDMLLITAVRSGDIKRCAELLLEFKKGADTLARNQAEPEGFPLLHWAVLDDQVEMARFLVHGETGDVPDVPSLPSGTRIVDINARTSKNETALHWAALRGFVRSVHFLLECGADLRAVDVKGYNALHRAAQNGQVQVVALLHRRGLDLDEKDNDGRTALHWAAYTGESQMAQWLIDHKANIAAADNEKCYALHWAALKGNVKMCRLLVKAGAQEQVYSMDITNADPEMLAAQKMAKSEEGSYVHKQFQQAKVYLAAVKVNKGDPYTRKYKIPHFSWFFWPLGSPFVWYIYYVKVFPLTAHLSFLTFMIWFGFWPGWLIWLRLQFKDPGYLVLRDEDQGKKPSNKYATIGGQTETAITIDDAHDTRATIPNPGMPGASRYRELYDNALDRGLAVPVCTTCEIVKPLRSKHDRVTNKCVAKFDHYCPWMNVAIGQNNYREFFFSMFFSMIAIWAWIGLIISYTWNVNRDNSWFGNFWDNLGFELFAWFFVLIGLYAIAMVTQHIVLIKNNMTTNEMMNRYRYRYLILRNPFDQGTLGNWAEFLGFQSPVNVDVKEYYSGEFEGMSAVEGEAKFAREISAQGATISQGNGLFPPGDGHGHSHGGGHGHSHGNKKCSHSH